MSYWYFIHSTLHLKVKATIATAVTVVKAVPTPVDSTPPSNDSSNGLSGWVGQSSRVPVLKNFPFYTWQGSRQRPRAGTRWGRCSSLAPSFVHFKRYGETQIEVSTQLSLHGSPVMKYSAILRLSVCNPKSCNQSHVSQTVTSSWNWNQNTKVWVFRLWLRLSSTIVLKKSWLLFFLFFSRFVCLDFPTNSFYPWQFEDYHLMKFYVCRFIYLLLKLVLINSRPAGIDICTGNRLCCRYWWTLLLAVMKKPMIHRTVFMYHPENFCPTRTILQW